MRGSISGDFKFVATGPIGILIAGGILMIIIGTIMRASNIFNSPSINTASGLLIVIGVIFVFLGIGLYMWERE